MSLDPQNPMLTRVCHFCEQPIKNGEPWGCWLVTFHQDCVLDERYRDEVEKQKELLMENGRQSLENYNKYLTQKSSC